jgi:two-component system KDP operon response regulator KdpE
MNARAIVLIIDDELAMRKLLRSSMPEELEVLEAASAREGLRLLATNNPRVVLLDLGLPDLDGLEVIRQVREFSQVPIIILSARENDGDKVAALDAGANDYLTKPFSVAELHARMRVALRSQQQSTPALEYQFGDVKILVAAREVTKAGKAVHLTPIEFELLLYLLRHADKVLTHKQILGAIWGPAYVKETQYLRVFMGNLRHKLEKQPARPLFLVTESGIGYRFRSAESGV